MLNYLFLKKQFLVFLLLLQFGKIFCQDTSKPDTSFSFDSFVKNLEAKYAVRFYYKPEWFQNNKIKYSSVNNLSLPELLDRIKTVYNYNYVTIDSTLIVIVPVEGESATIKNSGFVTVGNINEYGKYTKAVFSGRIVESKSGHPLPGATLYSEKCKIGAAADKNGNFKITLPVGEQEIKFSFIGLEDNVIKINLVSNGALDVELFDKTIKLNEVVITSNRADINISGTQMSAVRLDSKGIKELPVSFGETDIIKSMSLLPGIQSIGEFGTGFNVRGGGSDQNLILIEDEPLFNSSHLFGLSSILNPDGVLNVSLLKGAIPANYGERASSLLDIKMGNPTPEKFSLKGGLGLLNSRLTSNIPIIKNKITLLIGGRTTYSDWLLHKMPDIDLKNSSAGFYDINGFLTIAPNNRNKITVFGYFSNDKFTFNSNTKYSYSSTLASIRWNHVFNKKLSSSLTTGLSSYSYTELNTSVLQNYYQINSKVQYNNLKWNVNWQPSEKHHIDFGFNGILYSIKPGDLLPYGSKSLAIPFLGKNEKANELAGYISDNINLSTKFSVEIGVRFSIYQLRGPDTIYTYAIDAAKSVNDITGILSYANNKVVKQYSGLEPRLSLRLSTSETSSVKLSYTRNNQYINIVSNTSVMTPSDIWMLSNPYNKPLKCNQFAFGYYRNFKNNVIETSVELYYKTLKDIVEYKNGARILLNKHIETDLIPAFGYNYGIELYVKRNTGKLTGWLSYTFSRSLQKTNGTFESEKVNNNNYFPSNYDRPHNLVINANYHLTRRWRVSGSFTYCTGRPVTLPELKYRFNPGLNYYSDDYTLVYYSDRNKYRLPDYHRLDVSITLDGSLRHKTKWKSSWTFSIINLYFRKNLYSSFYKGEIPAQSFNHDYHSYSLYALYIIGKPLPTLTYNFSF